MRTVKVTYSNGAVVTSDISGTDAEIYDYFAIGTQFNIGTVADNVQQVTAVVILPLGLPVRVYRPADGISSANGGASSKYREFILTGPSIKGCFAPDNERPELRLQVGAFNTVQAIPADLDDAEAWAMFGGNFIYSSDSRFAALNNGAPIKIHDRVET